MSPEQAVSMPLDHRADIFALGSILFELLTLRRAWARDEHDMPLPAIDAPIPRDRINNHLTIFRRISVGTRPRPSLARPGLSSKIDAVVVRALAIDPEDRFQRAADLAHAFRAAALGEMGEPREPASAGARTLPDTPVVRFLEREEREEREEDGEDEDEDDGLTSVMPSDQDGRNLVDGRTRTEASPGGVTIVDVPPAMVTELRVSPPPVAVHRERSTREPQAAPAPVPAKKPIFVRNLPMLIVLAVGMAIGAGAMTVAQRAQHAESAIPINPEVAPTAIGAAGAPQVELQAEPAPEPESEPAPAPSPSPQTKRPKRPAVPEPSAAPAEVPRRPSIDPQIAELLERAKSEPKNLQLVAELSDRIMRAADALPNGDAKTAIRREAISSTLVADVEGLESCARRLQAERNRMQEPPQ